MKKTRSTTDHTDIARIGDDQINIAADILARAFHTDPPLVYAIPDAVERARKLPAFFRPFVRYTTMFGDPLTTATAPEAIALWLPLDKAAETPEEDFKAGIHEIPSILGREAFARLMPVLDLAARLHQKCPRQASVFAVLGRGADAVGEGLGSSLIRAMLKRANAESLPCYLETFEARNVPLYQSHGFTIVVEEVEPHSGIRGWGFLRAER